jgi:hypothetical protein
MSSGVHRKEPRTFNGAVVDDANPPQTRKFITNTNALVAIGAGQAEFSEPTDSSDVTAAGARWVFQTDGSRQFGLEFFGTGADNATFSANIRGFRRYPWPGARPTGAPVGTLGQKFPEIWRPRPLIELSGALGTYAVSSDHEKREPLIEFGGATIRGADVLSADADYTYAQTAKVVFDDGTIDNWAALVFDPMGCELISVELSCGSGQATSMIAYGFRL